MDRALNVLSDLSTARRLVRETAELVERLEAALAQPNRVAVFADLRGQMERATALRNRVARTRRDLMRLLEQRQPGAASEVADLLRQMRAIERYFDGMPVDDADFAEFDDGVLGRYRRLGRELGRMEVELQGMEARIVAMERYLEDTEEQRDPQGVAAMRNELTSHRASVAEYREQIRQLRIALEAARIQVGVGDARYERHDRLRREHARLAALVQERIGARDPALAALFGRVDRVERQLEGREQEILRIVDERTAEIRRQLQEEAQRIVGYRQALTELEQETEEVVGAVTYDNYRQVQQRFYDLVLRADVGRIDVAWARREEHRMRVEMLTRDRAREMRTLDDEFREIMDEAGTSEEGEGQAEGIEEEGP